MISVGLDMIIMIDLSARDDAKNTIRSYKIPKRYVDICASFTNHTKRTGPMVLSVVLLFLLSMTPVEFLPSCPFCRICRDFCPNKLG